MLDPIKCKLCGAVIHDIALDDCCNICRRSAIISQSIKDEIRLNKEIDLLKDRIKVLKTAFNAAYNKFNALHDLVNKER